MKQLKLDIDALTVTSFPTAPAAEARGTVQAHVATTPTCPKTFDCTYEGPDCVVTGGINSCWCSEYNTCDCV
jgi:hypothetical protein